MPKYLEVYNILRKRIVMGVYSKNTFLPPEPNLEKEFSVSRVTIRKAIENLVSDGLLVVRQGIGTMILDKRPPSQHLTRVTSLTETLKSRGVNVEYRNFRIETVPADVRVALPLGMKTGEDIVHLYRAVLANGQPTAIMENYVLPSLVPDIERHYHAQSSLYAFFEEFYGIKIESALDNISARMPTEAEMEELGLKEPKPLLTNRRIAYTLGKPFTLSDSSNIADSYEYVVYIRGRPDREGSY